MGKVKVTTWVDERTVDVVRGLAAQNGVSMSEMCAEMLRVSVAERAGEVGAELLLPALRGAIRREVAKMSDRLAHLSSRGAYESAATAIKEKEKVWPDVFVYLKHEESGTGPKLAKQLMGLLGGTGAVPSL